MTERRDFIEDYCRQLYSFTELCAHYGISRDTGDKWVDRFREEGWPGLVDRRRVPGSCPHRTPERIAVVLIAGRQAHPTWGPRKLLPYLAERHPGWT